MSQGLRVIGLEMGVSAQFGKRSGGVGVLKEAICPAIDVRAFVANQLPEAGSKDGVVELSLADIVPGFTAVLHAHCAGLPGTADLAIWPGHGKNRKCAELWSIPYTC
jgi:hypothetical protein